VKAGDEGRGFVRVLIVDDDLLFVEALDALVTEEGHTVVGRAANGRDGVDLALALRPEVVLMDMEMPIMDGLLATRETASQLEGTEVVVLSGSDIEAHILGARSAGAIAYVRKDRFREELPAVLRALSESHAS
jgi:DNA-binding NarL/FixJ family response regulator